MNRKFANPYVIFYPVVSRDGMPFPVNKTVRDIQGQAYKPEYAWRGNIVVAKYRENPFSSMIDASMADFPILKNYFLTHGSPQSGAPQHWSLQKGYHFLYMVSLVVYLVRVWQRQTCLDIDYLM